MTNQSNFYVRATSISKVATSTIIFIGKPTHPFNALCVIYPHVEVAFKDKFAHRMGQNDPNE